MDFLLTKSELIELSGYKLPRYQCRWLSDNGIKFYVDRFGHPKVVREVFYQSIGIRTQKEVMPDFEALEALNGKK